MLRLVIIALIIVFVLTLIRAASGIIRQAMLSLDNRPDPGGSGSRPQGATTQAELKRDPVCGTFVPANTAVQTTVKGKTFYFCSPECRDRYAAG